MPKGKYTLADIAPDSPSPAGKYTAADVDTAAPATQPSAPKPEGFLSSAVDASGLSTIAHAIAHPVDSAKAFMGAATYGGGNTDNPIINSLKSTVANTTDNAKEAYKAAKSGNYAGAVSHGISAVPIIGPTLDKATDQYADQNYRGEMGTLAGLTAGLVAPTIAKRYVPAVAARAATNVGEAGQDAGIGLLNKTAGMLKADFKRGANGARGYFAVGNGPAWSMQDLADKAASSQATVGGKIGDAVDTATAAGKRVPTMKVAAALTPPIQKGIDLETGPGGMGNTASIENYSAGFRPALQDAVKNGGMTPRELFDMKRGVAQNTNWSDPSQFNLKAIRQQQTGALSGVLSDSVPELPELNQQYGDLNKFATRAQSRADTHSMPLTSLAAKTGMSTAGAIPGLIEGSPIHATLGAAAGILADSVPVKSTVASGLYYGGKKLSSAGNWLMPPARTSMKAVTPYNVVGNKSKKN